MGLVIDSVKKVFDTGVIKKGCLIYGKHQSWREGRKGFVTAVTEKEITVQYHPGIANVTNHFFIPVTEVTEGQWELRWSDDLLKVYGCLNEPEPGGHGNET